MLKIKLEANDDNYKAQPCVLWYMPKGNEKAEGKKLELEKMENGELSVSSDEKGITTWMVLGVMGKIV